MVSHFYLIYKWFGISFIKFNSLQLLNFLSKNVQLNCYTFNMVNYGFSEYLRILMPLLCTCLFTHAYKAMILLEYL